MLSLKVENKREGREKPMAKSALEKAEENLSLAETSKETSNISGYASLYAQMASVAAQIAIAKELQRVANALWILVEQKEKK